MTSSIKEIFEKFQEHIDNCHVLPSGIRIGFEQLKSEILQKEQELLKDKILGISDDVWILISYNKFKNRNDRFEELKKKWCKE